MFPHSLYRIIGHQDWIRYGIRDRFIRAVHNPDTCTPKDFKVPFYGKTYKGNFSTFIDWSTYYFGAYCKGELQFIKDVLVAAEDPIVFDIGANIGHHSLFSSVYAKKVHAFEPFPEVVKKLEEKIAINDLKNILVHPIGLGNTNEELMYYSPEGNNTGTGSFIQSFKIAENTKCLPIRKGDEYVEVLQLSHLDLIKIDVEGFEPQVMQGLNKTLNTYRPIVFFEWSANNRRLDIGLKELFPPDFLFFEFHYNRPTLQVFNRRGYYLRCDTRFVDGNKVAVPKEKLTSFLKKVYW